MSKSSDEAVTSAANLIAAPPRLELVQFVMQLTDVQVGLTETLSSLLHDNKKDAVISLDATVKALRRLIDAIGARAEGGRAGE